MEDFEQRKMKYNMEFDFDEEDIEEEEQSGINYITIVAVLVALAGFISLSWYAYESLKKKTNDEEVPVLTNNNKSPYKVISDMELSESKTSDKEFFSNFSKEDKSENEEIAVLPEEPIIKSEIERKNQQSAERKALELLLQDENTVSAAAPKNTPSKEEAKGKDINDFSKEFGDLDSVDLPSDKKHTMSIENNQIAEPVEKPMVTKESSTAQEEKTEKKVAVITSKEKNSGKKTIDITSKKDLNIKSQKKLSTVASYKKSGKNNAQPSSSSIIYHESFRVQIASFKSKSEVLNFWHEVQSENIDIFGGLEPHIEQKNADHQTILYRLQVGAFVNYINARNLCNKLKNREIDCFVVKS